MSTAKEAIAALRWRYIWCLERAKPGPLGLVRCTKYRKPILKGDLAHRFRALAREVCSELKVEIIKGVVSSDHIHMLVSIPPQLAVSKLVQRLKGKMSYKLQREFKSLHKAYWGQRMWARGYFACSTGNVSSEMIAAYIEGHTEKENFKVADFET